MKKKKLWTAVITALALILSCGAFYYQGKPWAQRPDSLALDSSVSQELHNDPLTASNNQYAFLGGTSSENEQATVSQSNFKPDLIEEERQDKAPTGSTYNKEASMPQQTSGQPAVNQEKSTGSTLTSNQKPVVNAVSNTPSRSSGIYNKLSPNKGIYGQFRYRELSGGRIEIDPQWVAQNIVTITLPGLNRQVQVNRAAKDKFILAFNYIKNGTAIVNGRKVSLLSLIKTMDGTFVSRHANWNPSSGLSNHSWGAAIDINASNHFGYVSPTQKDDPNLILWEKAFKPAGFSWGNSYSDSMHFELLN